MFANFRPTALAKALQLKKQIEGKNRVTLLPVTSSWAGVVKSTLVFNSLQSEALS